MFLGSFNRREDDCWNVAATLWNGGKECRSNDLSLKLKNKKILFVIIIFLSSAFYLRLSVLNWIYLSFCVFFTLIFQSKKKYTKYHGRNLFWLNNRIKWTASWKSLKCLRCVLLAWAWQTLLLLHQTIC